MSTSPKRATIRPCFHNPPCNDDLYEGGRVPVPPGERLLMPICQMNTSSQWGDLSPQEFLELVYVRSFNPEFQPPSESKETELDGQIPLDGGELGYMELQQRGGQVGSMQQRKAAYVKMLLDIARKRKAKDMRGDGHYPAHDEQGSKHVPSLGGKDIEVVRRSVFGEELASH